MKKLHQIKEEIEKYKKLAKKSLMYAKKIGADEAEINIKSAEGLRVSSLNKSTENIESEEGISLTIKIIKDKKKGSASTAKLNNIDIEKTIDAAYSIANVTERDEYIGLADPELLMQTKQQDLELCFPSNVDSEFLKKMAFNCEEGILENKARSNGCQVNAIKHWMIYGNTNDFLEGTAKTTYSVSGTAIADLDKIYREQDYTISKNIDQLVNPYLIGSEAAKKAFARKGACKIKTQKLPIIFKNSVASGIISSIAGAINGYRLYKKDSFLLDKINQQITNKDISIYENPHIISGWGSRLYDSEGVATRPRTIIENGILKTYILDSYSAKRLNMQTTGNCGGITNWIVSNNGISYADLLKKMDKGLLITGLIGHGTNLTNGDYSRGAEGFYIENGKIKHPVDEITIASNLKNMLLQITSIDNEPDSRLQVSSGSILINEMQISGS